MRDNWNIGDKVTYHGKAYTIVREAKPLEFWIRQGFDTFHSVVTMRAFDLIAGDDPDTMDFDLDFQAQIQGDALRFRK
jgi:hypothetical protein